MTNEEIINRALRQTKIRKDRRRHLMVRGYMTDQLGVRHYCARSIPYSVWLWDFLHPTDVLTPGFNIHHKDENKLNDAPENHIKWTTKQHAHFHMRGNVYSLGHKLSQEHKDKIRDANIGKTLTQNHKDKIALGKKRSYDKKKRQAIIAANSRDNKPQE